MNKLIKIAFLFLLFGCMYSNSFAIIPDRTYRFYPEKMGLIYKDLDVKTSDGLMIKTWFFPAQLTPSDKELETLWENPVKKTYCTIDNKRRPTIIICNGDAGNMSWQQLVYAQYFTDKGYNVVTFDWRGFGESSEWEMNTDYLVYSELLIDYDAVIKTALQQKEVDTSAIVVFGWSTGAYLSMAAASKYSNIKAFIAIGLITTFEEVYPVLKKVPKDINRNLIIPLDYPMELQPLELAPTWDKATFLIVGELDDRSPVWMSEKIFAQLSSKKELWIVEGAEHGGNKGPARDFSLLNRRIIEFLGNSLQNNTDTIPPKQSFVVKLVSAYTNNLNYYTITGLMTLESSFIPFPSEIVVPPAAYQACNPENTNLYVTESKWLNIAIVIFFASLGAMLGAIINYFLALLLGRPVIYWFVETKLGKLCNLDTKKVQKAEDYFVKNGSITTFIGRFIPGIRQLISIPAGLAKMKMRPFLLYTFLGAALWNLVLAVLGYFAHGQQAIINKYSSEISYSILGLAVLFGIYLIWKAFKKKG